MKIKIIRSATIPESLNTFCKGLLRELREQDGYEVVAVSSPGAMLDNVGKREGIRTVAVPIKRRISLIKDLKSLWQLIKVFRRERPTIVHSMTPKAGMLSMIAAWFSRVPIRIHTFTGLIFPTASGLTQKILIFTDRITCACATHIIPEGEGVKNDLINYKITKKPLKVLGHGNVRGIDLDHYNPYSKTVQAEAKLIRNSDTFTFIFVGRIVKDKGINELVEAFVRVNSEYPETRLILVGSEESDLDPIKPSTLNVIKTNECISAVGPQSDVRPWLLASDVFVLTSYREGFPNVVIEAGAMGLPSIVTDINGSREIIIENENGHIIPTKDVDALYESMKSMLINKSDLVEMRKKARPMIASRFEQSFVRRCLKEFYLDTLRNKNIIKN